MCIRDSNDTSFQTSFGTKIRKKSWKFFDEFIGMIFGTDKPIIEEYQFTSVSTGYAYFEAFTSVWLRVWKVFIPFLEALNVDIRDTKDNLKDIENYMKDIDMYHKRSMWTGQSTCTKSLIVPGSTSNKSKEKETTPPWEDSKNQDTERKVDTGITDAMELLRRNRRSDDYVVIDREDRSSRRINYGRDDDYVYSRSYSGRSSFSGFTLATDLPVRGNNRWSSRDRRYR